MINYKKIRSMKPEELAEFLCDVGGYENGCSECYFSEDCGWEDDGMYHWLMDKEWEV